MTIFSRVVIRPIGRRLFHTQKSRSMVSPPWMTPEECLIIGFVIGYITGHYRKSSNQQ